MGKKVQESTAWKKLMLKPFLNKYPKRIVGHHTEPAPGPAPPGPAPPAPLAPGTGAVLGPAPPAPPAPPAVHIPAIGAVLGPAPGPAPALASATATATTPSKVIPIVSSGSTLSKSAKKKN